MQIKQIRRQTNAIPKSSKRPKRLSLVAALGVSTLLSACGGSPSEADVRAALTKQLDQGKTQAEQLMGKNSFLDQRLSEERRAVDATKLIGCKSDGEKAYLCDIENKAGTSRVRMLKGSEGWIAADPAKG
ncbi:hypothetical protein [Caballeronia sp. GAFFF2]|uniref:hypothetical protein n=1 Tax=Caballeronia sp. GAFFF2 TaxID=2921741 RepID=UPI0020289123|nr:hypothetical protein [Caballeronia sp. GAFFF2]